MAPLSVFFDASGTTDPDATSRPFHDLEYTWNFDDPGSGTWTYGAQPGVSSKNAASGPLAAHVFETAGTYTVTLTATDGTNSASTTTTITVSDPETVFAGTNTICFSTTGTFTDCPSGATHVTTLNFVTAINDHQDSNRRLLFRRGEIFSAASSALIDKAGPGIVGAYGSGAKPVINGSGSAPALTLNSPGSTTYSDWRLMDLSINGQNGQAGENVGISAIGPFNQVSILRVDVAGTSTGFAASHWILSAGDQSYDQWTIQDSTATGVPDCNWTAHYICNWRIYVVGTRWSMQGNSLDNLGDPSTLHAGGSHVIRTEMLQDSVISNNSLKGAGDFQLNIKLHAWAWDGSAGGNATPATYSEKVIIADNKIEGGANPWMVSLGPQDDGSDERVRDVIVERNWFKSNSATQMQLHVNSADTTIRNNICDLATGPYHTGIGIYRSPGTVAPANVHVYNNTIHSGPASEYFGVDIGPGALNTIVRNNLGLAPSASNPVMISGTGTGLVESNNLLNNSPSALFVSATPSAPADFRLKALPNPARDTGLSTVPVLSDFFGTRRPQNGAIDIGAVEGPN